VKPLLKQNASAMKMGSRIFCVLMAINILYGCLGPRYDWYVPLKIMVILSLYPVIPLSWIPFVKGGQAPARNLVRYAAAGLALIYCFPGMWPLNLGSPWLWYSFFVLVLFLEVFLCLSGQLRKKEILSLLLPWLVAAGTFWASLDSDGGTCFAALLMQLYCAAFGFVQVRKAYGSRSQLTFLFALLLFSLPFIIAYLSFIWLLPEPVYLLLALSYIVVLYKAFPLMNP
jgi:hypothetical protein